MIGRPDATTCDPARTRPAFRQFGYTPVAVIPSAGYRTARVCRGGGGHGARTHREGTDSITGVRRHSRARARDHVCVAVFVRALR